jgi:hypothetical protein
MFKYLIAAICLMAGATTAHAHFVWLERDEEGQARAYFGEWVTGETANADNYLPMIGAPVVFHEDPSAALAVTRHFDHLSIAETQSGDLRLVERGIAPRERKDTGKIRKTIYHAKAGRSGVNAALDLELVPVQSGANEFRLLLRGKPLAETGVTVFGPPKWLKPLETDEAGLVTIPTPWAGQYVVEVEHVEELESNAEGYDEIRHVFSLTFAVTE